MSVLGVSDITVQKKENIFVASFSVLLKSYHTGIKTMPRQKSQYLIVITSKV
jgi:hypothetical protein